MAKQKALKMGEKHADAIPSTAFDEVLLAWQAPAFLRYERGWVWVMAVLGICGALALYAYWTAAYAMLALFVVLPVVLMLEHRKIPPLRQVVVSPYGIRFGELRMPYSHIKRFWILHRPPTLDELHLLTDSKLHPELTIQLSGTDATLLRQYLVTQVLEWEGKNLSLYETLIRVLRLT